ncbi:hypothetical protein [Anaerosalibacter massiliensis]|uniref:Uncharacterized protein n=1 Tax=Anaerosalibacter massiliensis TaxID=1347392 RepID=A0A9X2S6G1_9FIRM|nr:hypothetical protein [Anaerosalibacter massiliensis]MCR2043021.1 hypothetical protein [Anaerosalibacter massiliensis]
MRFNKANVPISILTIKGPLTSIRDYYFCRYYHKSIGYTDESLNINKERLVIKRFMELIAYSGQNSRYFERASKYLEKYKGLKISSTTIEQVSEQIVKKVY